MVNVAYVSWVKMCTGNSRVIKLKRALHNSELKQWIEDSFCFVVRVCLYLDTCSFQEVLSIAVGPRSEDEVCTVQQIGSLLDKVRQTLRCRKVQTVSVHLSSWYSVAIVIIRLSPPFLFCLQFMSSVAEQMMLRCTVLLACKLGDCLRNVYAYDKPEKKIPNHS